MTGIERMQIESNQSFIQNPLDHLSEPVTKKNTVHKKETDTLEFDLSSKKFIQQALDEENIHTQAVYEARKSLESGELDTILTARKTAEALLQFGI